LLIVLVPLLGGLLFIGTLYYLLWQSERASEEQLHESEIQDSVNHLTDLYLRAVTCAWSYAFLRAEVYHTAYQEAIDDGRVGFRHLCELVKDDPVRVQHVQKMQKLEKSALDLMDSGIMAASDGDLGAQTLQLSGVRQQLKAVAMQLQLEKNAILVSAAPVHRHEPTHGFEIKQFILLAAALNVAMGLAAGYFFVTSISRRIDKLIDNTIKASSDKALNPPVGGTDEVAVLDRTFREMVLASRHAAEREHATLDNASDVICSISRDLKFVDVSPACNDVLGHGQEELIGQRIIEMLEQSQVEIFRKLMQANTPGNSKFEAELTVGSKHKHTLWSVSWSPSTEEFYCVVIDVTERNEFERFKRELIAMVTHDLRSPLTSLRVTLNMLENGTLGTLNQKGTGVVHSSELELERLIDLINGLLDIEKMRAGKLALHRQVVDVDELVNRSIQSIAHSAQKKSIELSYHPSGIEAFADGAKIVQVLVNLISNAVKFSPENTAITVAAKDAGDEIEISVQDQGRGIPESHLTTIFNQFEQVMPSDSQIASGSGLGLAICKNIVEAHGGTIGVESANGQGSRFWFRLPTSEEGSDEGILDPGSEAVPGPS
jgi:PAS domain S-box-containing protein